MDSYVCLYHQSELDGSFYVGMTNNYEKRLSYHNSGRVKSTKAKKLWKIVHLEDFITRIEAREREKYLKSAAGRRFRRVKLGL